MADEEVIEVAVTEDETAQNGATVNGEASSEQIGSAILGTLVINFVIFLKQYTVANLHALMLFL